MRKLLSILLTAGQLLWLPDISWGQLRPSQAQIIFLKGRAEVLKSGESTARTADLSMELSSGDRVMTEAGSEAEIRLSDGSILKLKDKGLLEINELRSRRQPEAIAVSLKLSWGKLLGCVRKLSSQESKFEVATPTAVAGVRGTVFAVFSDGDSTELDVLKGQVAIMGSRGQEKVVGGKQYTVVAKGDSARSPLPMTAAKIAFMTAWAGAALKLGSMGAAGAKSWYASTPFLVGGGAVAAAAVAAIIIVTSGGQEENPPPSGGGPNIGGPNIGGPPTLPNP